MNGAQEGVVFLLLSRGDPTDFDVLKVKFQFTEAVMGDRYRITDFRIIPEPSTALLLGLGLVGLATARPRDERGGLNATMPVRYGARWTLNAAHETHNGLR